MNRIWQTIKGIQAISRFTTEDVLGYMGLARQRSLGGRILPMAGSFAAGVVVGAGLGILFAPASGDETRKLVLERAAEINRALRSRFSKTEPENSASSSGYNAKDRDDSTSARA